MMPILLHGAPAMANIGNQSTVKRTPKRPRGVGVPVLLVLAALMCVLAWYSGTIVQAGFNMFTYAYLTPESTHAPSPPQPAGPAINFNS